MSWAQSLSRMGVGDDTAPGLPLSMQSSRLLSEPPGGGAVRSGDAASLETEPPPPVSIDRNPALPCGAHIGNYILKEAIATGGFGVVYRAEHAVFGTPAAVKVLHPELALAREAVIRFEREVQAIRRIDHPNVVRILDYGELSGGRPYFAMELLSGLDVESYLRAVGRLSPDEALGILEPVCAALTAAHNQAIIHRDFKASNVFLADEKGQRRVVLLDFGVAKVLDDSAPGITSASHILGTPACMAPEQITGKPADARTDVYALGALAYYMLVGELPFIDSSLVALLHMHLHARPPSPSREAPVSPVFDAVVTRAMAKSPEARFATVAEFLEAFRTAVEDSRGAATPRTPRLSLSERRMGAIHIEIYAEASALEEPDDGLLSDMEEVLPLAVRTLKAKGYSVTVQTGNTALLMIDISVDGSSSAGAEAEARRELVRTGLDLERELRGRPSYDARVQMNICLHAGPAFTAAEKVIGGELLDLGTWVPQAAVGGVAATSALLEGLGLATEGIPDAPGLSRVVAGA